MVSWFLLDEGEGFGDGEAFVAGAFGHGFVDGLAGGREHQDVFVCRGARRRATL